MNSRGAKRTAARCSGSCRLLWSPVLAMSCLAAGCSGGETIWLTEMKSPDGQWVAIGRTDQYGGPGNAAVITGVYLQHAQGDKRTDAVVSFSDNQSPADARIIPASEWLTPKHLQISFRRHVDLDLQVVKYADIEISVRDLSSANGTN